MVQRDPSATLNARGAAHAQETSKGASLEHGTCAASHRQHIHGKHAEPAGGFTRRAGVALQVVAAQSSSNL
jgi:hypothetical protein